MAPGMCNIACSDLRRKSIRTTCLEDMYFCRTGREICLADRVYSHLATCLKTYGCRREREVSDSTIEEFLESQKIHLHVMGTRISSPCKDTIHTHQITRSKNSLSVKRSICMHVMGGTRISSPCKDTIHTGNIKKITQISTKVNTSPFQLTQRILMRDIAHEIGRRFFFDGVHVHGSLNDCLPEAKIRQPNKSTRHLNIFR